ncbi:MAG TPA: hypothetical protein VFQ73_04235 [Flavisolibacter sp.]|nr:hypothetical protein [Flavisolibacter sp.]
MELKAIVQFEGGLAHYNVLPETNGIYQARLLQYDGNSEKAPPSEVILVRGYRQWSGSYERQDLLNDIGNVIESRSRNGNPGEVNTRPVTPDKTV